MGLEKRRIIKRRDFLTGIASVPLLGASQDKPEQINVSIKSSHSEDSEPLRLGIIGYGKRGEALLSVVKSTGQNVELRGVSDIFGQRLERGLVDAGSNAKAYKNYLDLLDSDLIDAVIIATPDHWHAPMAIDAARRGKHIYLEKCMTRTPDEALALRDAVRKSGVVFQLGHQGRQRDLNIKARELIDKDTLGKITLIETTTNRNDPSDSWKAEWEELASSATIKLNELLTKEKRVLSRLYSNRLGSVSGARGEKAILQPGKVFWMEELLGLRDRDVRRFT